VLTSSGFNTPRKVEVIGPQKNIEIEAKIFSYYIKIFRCDLNKIEEKNKFFYFALFCTERFLYRSTEHRCSHGMSRPILAFFVIKLSRSVRF
jgi:hypothetical protein